MRGKHQTTCKAGKKTIERIQKIAGVKSVIIGRSFGGKGLHQAQDGTIKLQASSLGAITAVMQTSKGVQNLTILLGKDADEWAVRNAIEELNL